MADFFVKSSHSGIGREALDNEVKILKNIVQFLGTEEDQGNLDVFTEYMAWDSLADVAQKFEGSLDEEVVESTTNYFFLFKIIIIITLMMVK